MSVNFKTVCRLCMLQNESMQTLFDANCTLPCKIMAVLPALKIYKGDNLPAQVCRKCIAQINSFYSFKLQCENTNITLNKYLENQQSESQSTEICKDWRISPEVISEESCLYRPAGGRNIIENDSTEEKKQEKNNKKLVSQVKEESFTQGCDYEIMKIEPDIEFPESNQNQFKQDSPVNENIKVVNKTVKLNIASKEKTVSCQICGKLVVRKRANEHFKRHTGGRPFKCDECGKSYQDRNSLNKHTLVHSGLKAHMCDICGKRFKLLTHLKTHHLIHTGQKLHVCDVCGKRFNQLGNFKKHELLHTGEKPFNCDICGKSYSQKNTLQIHLAVHAGQRQHVCKICGKGFLLKGHLKTHMVVHSGEKKFSCDVCGLSYSQRHSLKKHKRKHAIV